MLTPLMIAAIYTNALIFGPIFIIVLAICLGLTVKFPRDKIWISIVMVMAGFIEIFFGPWWVLWILLTGFSTIILGIVVFFSDLIRNRLPFSIKNHLSENRVHHLKKGFYAILTIMILSSVLVFSLRTTHVLREDMNVDWTYATTAGTTIRGIITKISLNCEVNCYGWYYHVFPALITVNVTEIVKVGESWVNLTEISRGWINQNMIVAYDKSDVPNLVVGQRVEVSGYFDFPVEDEFPYTNKLVIAMKIDGSYIKSL